MKESTLQRDVRLHLGQKSDLIIYRNNVGQYQDAQGNWVRYGLCSGSSDLIGMLTLDVADLAYPAFLHPCKIGRFFAAEIKTRTGRVTTEQDAFMALVNTAGGYACVIRSVEEAEEHYQRARKGLNAPR